ncbi:MAG: PaaI family thioesterase [Proteobacteria bacterium]|nr:PaaI family thioesterase [Pseudomonadota bacterium]
MNSDNELVRRFTHWDASSMNATGAWAERRRLAKAMREVIARLVEIDAPEEDLAEAANALERYSKRLSEYPKGATYEGWAETAVSGDAAAFFDHSPLIGLANPLSPPISLVADRDNMTVEGRAVFGSAFEGPPACVHGGFISAAFDEVLGFVNSLTGNPGMTARLTIDYKRPTPLHTDLHFKAQLDRVDGRKTYASGKVFADDRLTATAEALFLSVSAEKLSDLYMEGQERDRETESFDDE